MLPHAQQTCSKPLQGIQQPQLAPVEPNDEQPAHPSAIGVIVWQVKAYDIVEQQQVVHDRLFAKQDPQNALPLN